MTAILSQRGSGNESRSVGITEFVTLWPDGKYTVRCVGGAWEIIIDRACAETLIGQPGVVFIRNGEEENDDSKRDPTLY